MHDTNIAFLIGLMAGSIFFIDGWGPTTNEKDDFAKSKRFRGLAVLLAGGIITPVLDYVTTKKPEFFLAYLKGSIYGWFFVLLAGLVLYIIWISTVNLSKPKIICAVGKFAYAILDFIYLGISDNPHLSVKRKADIAQAEKLYGLKNDYEYKQAQKELENRNLALDKIDESTKKLVEKQNEETVKVKTEGEYTFNDWYYKGITEYDRGEYEKCIAYMKNALEKSRQHANAPDAYLYMGVSYVHLGLPVKALGLYDPIIDQYPKYENRYIVHSNRSGLLIDFKRYDEALAAVEESIRLKNDDEHSWFNKALLFNNTEKPDKAIEALDKVLSLNPKSGLAWSEKGIALIKLLRYDEAISAFNEAIHLNYNKAESWFNIACVFAYKNEKHNMLEYLEKAIAADPAKKAIARTDKDFNAYRDDPDFQKLVEG